ncbi:flagellar hook-associated protein 2 [Virgibacillus necropolis]|uniref:Flagellar hook-associated protein 2 n=1 Tax=Virgibacillus necropolis TaxID=163877 RepID=A0A221MAV0_9BACI|nr:flagellar hook-associated protein 2 [Virgibacillus necropolis]ASN04730.1 flagellar hook protein [Virgibacillus necropolis]
MRIGGLATGMDIDQLVGKLMKAERMPLDRMEQDKITLTWKRDAFRDVNKKLLELDNMMLGMKYDSTYNAKSVTSSMKDAVIATGTASSSNGVYDIEVTRLAESAINIGGVIGTSIDPNAKLADQTFTGGFVEETFEFYTFFDKDGNKETHSYKVSGDDTLNDVLNRITEDDNNVRAFFDQQSDKIVLETTRTGDYNQSAEYGGAEIGFDTNNEFFTNTLKLATAEESGGKNAEFIYNGALTINSKENNYTLNGITFEFKDVTNGKSAKLTVDNNVDASFESIMKFVDKYNDVVETLNESQREETYRDYKPLTDKQREELSEDEAKLWDEKAKSGILSNESIISDGMFSMRRSWYANVETGGDYTSLTQVGLTTSNDYMDGGKLIVDPVELKKALSENPDAVQKLFSNSEEGASRGIVNRLEDSLESTMGRIEERAGGGSDTLENYTLGKRMKDLNEQISAFEDRLVRVETRYWGEFTAMEKAIQRMNQQSAQLMSQFGGA